MPWNEPGSGKSPNRGNGRNRPNSDVEDILKNLKDSFGGGSGNSGNVPTGFLFMGIIAVLAIVILLKSIYIVKEGEESVVLQFGKYNRTDTAGLNFAWWPIQQKYKVDIEKIRTVEVGYRDQQSITKEALMLTNDENIVDVTMAVQYTIKDLQKLLFNVGDVEYRGELDSVVRGATESALREVVGSKNMDDLLTKGRREVDINTKDVLQTILDLYQTGIQVESIEIQDAKPPVQVSDAFDDVVKADQDKIKKENDAQAYANDLIPKARGEASKLIQGAEAYSAAVVSEANGEAERFNKILAEYRKAPEVTKKRLYIETMEEVLSNTNKVMVEGNNANNLMYLPIDKLINQQRSTNKSNSQIEEVQKSIDQTKTPQRNTVRSSIREAR